METEKKEAAQQAVTLEEGFLQMEEIVARMESRDVTLDESFALYQKGVETLKNCNRMLDAVEKKMQMINSDGTLTDF